MAQALVDSPDKVKVTREEDDDDFTTFLLSVDNDDLGKVIGRRGRTAQAMRSILTAAATKKDMRASLEIIE